LPSKEGQSKQSAKSCNIDFLSRKVMLFLHHAKKGKPLWAGLNRIFDLISSK
jgi:hypothetical protein